MASCELCGVDGVSTKRLSLHGAFVDGCKQCQAKLGYTPEMNEAAKNVERVNKRTSAATSGGYGGLGTSGKDIMFRETNEVAKDFPSRIRSAREKKGWNQRALALKMKEKVNIIQRAENGQRPSDSVIKKFEKTLGISLHSTSSDVEMDRPVTDSGARSLNLGDLIKMARKEGE